MELSDAQKVAVTQWIQEGRSLADVQRSLREDFEISMTYMDVRFLVDDLDITFVVEEAKATRSRHSEKVAEMHDDNSNSHKLDPVDKAAKKETSKASSDHNKKIEAAVTNELSTPKEEFENAVSDLTDEGGNRAVTVDVDPIPRPGSLVNGTVVFSDGVSLGWQLSAAGQLGLIPGDDPDYRPNPEDVQSFQSQLEELLSKKGF